MQNSRHSSLFACAHKVSVIEVGADAAELTSQLQKVMPPLRKRKLRSDDAERTLSSKFLGSIGSELTFDEASIRMMAPYMLPYNEQSIYEAFDTAEFLSKTDKAPAIPGGRFNARGSDNRHLSCRFKNTTTHRLKPIKRQIMKRAMEMQKRALADAEAKSAAAKEKANVIQASDEEEDDSRTFITSGKGANTSVAQGGSNQWDEYLVSILSKPTAQWVVSQKTSQQDPRFKALNDAMLARHGAPTTTELVEDEASDSEVADSLPVGVKDSERKTKSARLLRSVMEDEQKVSSDTLPYSDESKASFYRLPAGIKKELKAQQRAKEGAQNSTAANIVVVRKEPSPPPRLKDFVNPAIKTTVYDTDNMFERDWLTGNAVVHRHLSESPDVIQMENLNKYEKQLQQRYPRSPTEWHRPAAGADDSKHGEHRPKQGSITAETTTNAAAANIAAMPGGHTTLVHKVTKGLRRWTKLPKPIEEAELGIAADQDDEHNGGNEQASGTKSNFTEALVKAADEWRNKWYMNARFSDATEDDLIRDMADIHPHVRMKAVATCAMAATYKPPPVVGVALSMSKNNARGADQLSPRIFIALECLLDDDNDKVQLAAAVTLYTLNKPVEKAKQILRASIKPDKNQADRWAAVQCLGFYGENDSEVIGEVIEEMMRTQDMMKLEKAASLLAHISLSTPLVHSMLGEQLNDCSWRRRVMACKCLPKLHGELNRDLQNKLVHLLWSDTEDEVRHAAGQALGKCGYAKLVHDRLRDVLNGISAAGDAAIHQSDKVEAINKIGFLGLMTVQLLPSFIRCFHDEYVSIREATCKAAGRIRIKDPSISSQLVRLASQDPIWQIKAYALQAIGQVGYIDDAVRRCLLWALRFEPEAGVRAEACRAIIQLRLCDKEVLDTLQNHTLVEQDELVRQELAKAVELNGVSATEDMAMVAQIKEEVRRLCNRDDVYRSILKLERAEDKRHNAERMHFASSPTPMASDDDELDRGGDATDARAAAQQQQIARSEVYRSELLPLVVEELVASQREQSVQSRGNGKPVSSEGGFGNGPRPVPKVTTAGVHARPPSGASSYHTDAIDHEIDQVTSRMDAISRLSSDHKSLKSAMDTSRPATTGLAKRSARHSTTPGAAPPPAILELKPNLLSMSLDQTMPFHEDSAAASATHVGARQAAGLLQAEDFDKSHMHATASGGKLTNGESAATESVSSGDLDLPAEQADGADPVATCRHYTQIYLFRRYKQIDIATPSTLSPLGSREATGAALATPEVGERSSGSATLLGGRTSGSGLLPAQRRTGSGKASALPAV